MLAKVPKTDKIHKYGLYFLSNGSCRTSLICLGITLFFLFTGNLKSQAYTITSNPISAQINPGDLTLELVDFVQIPGTSGKNPKTRINYLHHAGDGSQRLFVGDMDGKIYIIKNSNLLATPFLDIAEVRGSLFISEEFELGLGSFAFHPNYGIRGKRGYGKFYTVHSEAKSSISNQSDARILRSYRREPHHYDVIVEWTVSSSNPNLIDPNSYREVLRINQPWWDHNTGLIAFNPNSKPGNKDFAKLYIGVGDGGNTAARKLSVDEDQEAQNLKTALGAVLRIDPLMEGANRYSVPKDNPFVDNPDALPELWAYGLRNPQRFSWDTAGNGTMFISDLGQNHIEEISIGRAGGNYGWSEKEGTFRINRNNDRELFVPTFDARESDWIDPVIQYDHDEGQAISGGFVYRGREIRELFGKYVFGDIVNGRIFYTKADQFEFASQNNIEEMQLTRDGLPTTLSEITSGNGRVDLRFGTDEAGELYLLTKQDGYIRQLQSRSSANAFFSNPDAPSQNLENRHARSNRGNTRSSFALNYWIAAIIILFILSAGAFMFLRPRKSSTPRTTKKRSSHSRIRHDDAILSGSSIELDRNKRILSFLPFGKRQKTPEIKLSELAELEIIANNKCVHKTSKDHGPAFSADVERELRTIFEDVHNEIMNHDTKRQIGLRIIGVPDSNFKTTINFYFREGHHRLTDFSYLESVEKIIIWYKFLAMEVYPIEEAVAVSNTTASLSPQTDGNDTKTISEPETLLPSAQDIDLADELTKLVSLKEKGFLTDQEFEKAKAKIIGR